MFLRPILRSSSHQSIKKITKHLASQQVPSFLASRKDFSTSPQQNALPKGGATGKPPEESKGGASTILLGGAVVAGATLLAYRSGYLDQFIGKEQQNSPKLEPQHVNENWPLEERAQASINEETAQSSYNEQLAVTEIGKETGLPHVEAEQKVDAPTTVPGVETEQKVESHVDHPHIESEPKVEDLKDLHQVEANQKIVPQHEAVSEKVVPQHEAVSETEGIKHLPVQVALDTTTKDGEAEGVQDTEVQAPNAVVPEDNEMKTGLGEDRTEAAGAVTEGVDANRSLETYHFKERAEGTTTIESTGEQGLRSALEEFDGVYITKDGKLVMDFLQAIHAAENRQAESDALAFAEEKRKLKAKYEKELRDSRARELMHAEEVAILDKELQREKAKAAAAIIELRKTLEEKLLMELEQKENETEMKVKKIQEFAKAELAAAIANEKAEQIKKLADTNINIDALCMAFFARSEEARQIHSVHKVALGALALEDALSKGQPIQQELDAMNAFLEGNDKDSLIHLVLSTLPEETRSQGTDTVLQLNQKFENLKRALRHYILIPPGGGGILPHALSRIASWLRIKEVDPSGEGIESVISRVDRLLAEGKLSEAANALVEGVGGSEAEEIANDWARQARNRAITEQALTVLQSYATGISLTQ